MKTYVSLKQHKIRLQNIKQMDTQQKYRLGMNSNIKSLGGLNRFHMSGGNIGPRTLGQRLKRWAAA